MLRGGLRPGPLLAPHTSFSDLRTERHRHQTGAPAFCARASVAPRGPIARVWRPHVGNSLLHYGFERCHLCPASGQEYCPTHLARAWDQAHCDWLQGVEEPESLRNGEVGGLRQTLYEEPGEAAFAVRRPLASPHTARVPAAVLPDLARLGCR